MASSQDSKVRLKMQTQQQNSAVSPPHSHLVAKAASRSTPSPLSGNRVGSNRTSPEMPPDDHAASPSN